MREIAYVDTAGRKFKVMLPDGAPDSDAPYGIVVGPPDLSSLELPLDIEVALNNQLYGRSIFSAKEAAKRSNELFAAWQAALRVNVQALLNLYSEPKL